MKNEIEELESKVENRDILIADQERLINTYKSIINSLEDDLMSIRNAKYNEIMTK